MRKDVTYGICNMSWLYVEEWLATASPYNFRLKVYYEFDEDGDNPLNGVACEKNSSKRRMMYDKVLNIANPNLEKLKFYIKLLLITVIYFRRQKTNSCLSLNVIIK